MFLYILIISIISFLAFYFFEKPKVSSTLFYACCILLGLYVGFADMLGGYDRYIYAEVFESISTRLSEGQPIFNHYFIEVFGPEFGYGLWNSLWGFFTPNRYIYITVCTLFIYILLAYNLYKQCRYPFFGLLIFMGLTFFFTFTYIRQLMAIMMVWTAIPLVYQKRYAWYTILVLIAFTFHNASIIALTPLFAPVKKHSWKTISWVMAGLLIAGVSGITTIFFSAYGDAFGEVAAKATGYAETAQHGFEIKYVLQSALLLYLLYRKYKFIDPHDKIMLVYLNFYLLFCGILLLFCTSSDGGRISWYFMIGPIYILTHISSFLRNIKFRYFIGAISVALYMRILLAWGVIIYPYKSYFSEGFPDNWIVKKYEYNYNYEFDKFYNL